MTQAKNNGKDQMEELKVAEKPKSTRSKPKVEENSNIFLLGGKKKVLVQITKDRFVNMEIQDEAGLPRELRIFLQVTEQAGTMKEVKICYDAESINMQDDVQRIKKALEK